MPLAPAELRASRLWLWAEEILAGTVGSVQHTVGGLERAWTFADGPPPLRPALAARCLGLATGVLHIGMADELEEVLARELAALAGRRAATDRAHVARFLGAVVAGAEFAWDAPVWEADGAAIAGSLLRGCAADDAAAPLFDEATVGAVSALVRAQQPARKHSSAAASASASGALSVRFSPSSALGPLLLHDPPVLALLCAQARLDLDDARARALRCAERVVRGAAADAADVAALAALRVTLARGKNMIWLRSPTQAVLNVAA